jgi:hypothetical protein
MIPHAIIKPIKKVMRIDKDAVFIEIKTGDQSIMCYLHNIPNNSYRQYDIKIFSKKIVVMNRRTYS